MTFYKDGFLVIRDFVPKKQRDILLKHISKLSSPIMNDPQVNNTPSFYGDSVFTKLQLQLLPKLEKHTKLNLLKTYTYGRVYKKGDILRIHKDRPACEISITIDLGGDKWPIWILDRDENPVKVSLNPGDVLVYRGCDIHHWRGKFDGNEHTQVFMHYVDKFGPYAWAEDDKIQRKPDNETNQN